MNNPTFGFTKEDPWRIFRIMAEFVDSFEILSQMGPAVTVFGSARTERGENKDECEAEGTRHCTTGMADR